MLRQFSLISLAALNLYGCAESQLERSIPSPATTDCAVELIILGVGQDGGAPQIDNFHDPAWQDPAKQMRAASAALVDHRNGSRILFEATPDMRQQLYDLERWAGPAPENLPIGLSGIFITHAHIGHYAGLMFAGHESAGADSLPVYVMPRMATYLSENGPWDQLVRYSNIDLKPLETNQPQVLSDDISITPYRVPHRDEYSETVGFVIKGPKRSVLFLPDIDDWDRWQTEYGSNIEAFIQAVDIAYLDATFFDDNELPGRDMSKIPHPRVIDSIARFSDLQEIEQKKVRFFHINHTNPIRNPDSAASKFVRESGFQIARKGDRECLG